MPVIESTETFHPTVSPFATDTPLQSTKRCGRRVHPSDRFLDTTRIPGRCGGARCTRRALCMFERIQRHRSPRTSGSTSSSRTRPTACRGTPSVSWCSKLEAPSILHYFAEYPIVPTNWDPKSQLMRQVPAGAARLGGTNNEPNAESILSHDPDLLVVGKGWWNYYQDKGLLGTDIAPVLVVDEGTTGSSWKQAMTAQLTALDRREVAERVIARYKRRTCTSAGQDRWSPRRQVDCDRRRRQRSDLAAEQHVRRLGCAGPRLERLDRRCPCRTGSEGFDFLQPRGACDLRPGRTSSCYRTPDAVEAESPTWKRVRAVQDGHVGHLRYDLNNGLALTAMALAR